MKRREDGGDSDRAAATAEWQSERIEGSLKMLEIRPAQGKARLPTSEHGGCGKKDIEKRAVGSRPTQTPVVMIS